MQKPGIRPGFRIFAAGLRVAYNDIVGKLPADVTIVSRLVVRAEALLGDRDGLFGQRNRFGHLPGLVEPDDLLVHGREVALRGSILHRSKGRNDNG